MSNFKISRIYFENYKLFTRKELVFTDCALAVLDGPNGYGKTSVFDAIEFLLTGNIKRVFDNSSILKTEAYETVFIAGNPKKDVIIKAEFLSEDNTSLVIAKTIPAVNKHKKGKKNNPTKLGELAITYILPSYDTNDYTDTCKCDQSEITNRIGNSVIDFFDLFYYIKQEDRLDFLKKTEKDRMAGINRLFNMQKEKDELENTNKAIRQLNKLFKDLGDIISSKTVEIKKLEDTLGKSDNTDVKYEKLLSWKKELEIWDEQVISVSDINKKDEMVNTIRGLQSFIRNYNEFMIEQKNTWCNNWLGKQSFFNYYLVLYPFKDGLGNVKVSYSSLKILKQQVLLFSNGKHVNINFTKIAEILKIEANLQLINEIVAEIANYEKNSNSLAKVASELNQAREILNGKALPFTATQSNNGHCTFCGYDWGSSEELIKQISKTTELFKTFSDESTQQKEDKIEELKNIFTSLFLPVIHKYIDEHKVLDNETFEYVFDPKNKVEETFQAFAEGCAKYNINIEKYTLDSINATNENSVQGLVNELLTSVKLLSNGYNEIRSRYDFPQIFNRYFNDNNDNVNTVSLERITKKINYIEHNYYNATFEKIEQQKTQLLDRENKSRLLGEEIIPKITKYKEAIKVNIEKYQNQIIKNIEIPFYIYTGRIMQSYQGGLGILIKEPDVSSVETENDMGLNSIRFISPSRPEHDIIYTLSSGQLSAVIISFTLALNKIYSNEMFRCIFIDDPVQTMDELNIASFVELMRNEFMDRQIILSTHEDSFSRYVRYKYSKYGLKVKR